MLPVIAVFAISAGILLAAQSGCSGAYPAGADGSYNTPDVGLFEYAPVQAVTEEGGMPNLTAACQIADTLADMLFTGVLNTAYAVHGVLSLTAVDNVTADSTLRLESASGIVTFESGGHTYAAVAAFHDHSVQILNITNPYNITAAGSITDTGTLRDTGTLELIGASSIATFESGGHTYAAVTAYRDHSVQILNITDPFNIIATDSITDTDTLELDVARSITTFNAGGHIYAAVAAYDDDGVQILNITDPSDITAADNITDTDTLELRGARGITTFNAGGHIYAAVTAFRDHSVQILNITNPYNITAAGSITDAGTMELYGARDITTFESDGHIYAAVTAYRDDGVQILNITNPYNITAADSITDTDTLELSGANGITVFNAGSHIYAAVAASIDHGVQILDITDPSAITAAASITNGDSLVLNAPYGITTFESGGHIYVVVTTSLDNGVQIIRIDPAVPDTTISDTAPTVSSIERYSPSTATTDSQTLVYRITFSEDVSGVDKADFALSSDSTGETNGNNPVTSISGSGSVYYAEVSASTDGTYNLDLVPSGHGIADTASNQLTNTAPTGADETYTVSTTITDTTVPTVSSIERYNPSSATTDSQTLVYRITFSEDVTGVGTADFALSSDSTGETNGNNPVASISGSGSVYYATVSVTTDGTYNLDLVSSGHGIADTASNQLTNTAPTGADETYTVSTTITDTTVPTVSSIERYNPSSATTDSQTLVYRITFSEDVTGVGTADFALSSDSTGETNGNNPVASISGSSDTYYATVSAITDGTYNLDLVSSGHGIADTASNQLTNTAPTGADETYTVSTTITDTTVPTVSSIERYNPSSATTDSQTLVYRITFSEDVTGVGTADFALSPGSAGGTSTSSGQFTQTRSPSLAITDNTTVSDAITVADSGTATSVTVAVDITHTYIGDLKIDLVAPDGTTKMLHNRSGGGTDDIDQTYTPDFEGESIAGTWTLRIRDNANLDSGTLNSWTLTINHGSTTTASPVTSISGSGSVYYAEVSASTDGTYNLDLVSSGHGIADTASNQLTNTAPTGADETYTVSTTITDTTVPTVSSIERYNPSSATTDSQTLVYRITFSEDVTGVGTADFALSPGSAGGTSTSSGQFTQTRSPSLAITDNTTVSDAITVADSGTATSVTVAVDITHTYIGDLKIDLIAPDGTTELVRSRSGGGTDDIDQTYTPDFEGESIAGTWTLRIRDNANLDSGTLNSWTLTINHGSSSSGTASPVTSISGSGSVYYAEVSASTDGTYNLDLVPSGHGIADTASNQLTNTAPTGADETYTVSTTITDTTVPTVSSIERYNPSSATTDSQTLVYRITFSEDVTGVGTADFALSSDSTGETNGNNPVASISGSSDTYYATVSASTDGTYNLDLVSSGHGIADTASNQLTNTAPTGADETYTVSTTITDTTVPTVSSIERYNPSSATTDSQTLVYRITFSEDVTGVGTADFALSPGSAGGTSTSSGQFTQTRSPSLAITDNTTVSDAITVADSGTATSVTVAVDITHTYIGDLKIDLIAPDGTTELVRSRSGGGTDDIDQTYTPDFEGESIAGTWTLRIRDNANLDSGTLNSWTLTINHGSSSSGTASPVTSISGSGSVYYAEVSASTDGTYNLDLVSSGHGIADTASNQLTNTAPTGADETYTVSTTITDTTVPTVSSIERYNPSSATTDSQTLVYRITFSEDVTGVGTADFALSSDSTGETNGNNPVASISGSGSVYYATVSVTTDGTYNLDLVSSGHGIADTASNQLTNTAPTGADETYTVSTTITDTTVPTVSSIERYNPSSATTDSQTLVYRITFSEDVTGVGTADFALSSDSTGETNGNNPVASISGSSDTYYATVSAITDGTYNLDLVSSGHGIADTASNQLTNTAPTGADETYTVSTTITDTTVPTVSSIERYNPSSATTDSQTLVYRITFSEDVTGVGTADFALSSDSTGETNGNNPVASISGSGSVYYATVSVTTDGTYNLDLVSSGHGIADTASNPLTNTAPTGADQTYTVSTTVVNTTNPRLESIERYSPTSQNTNIQYLIYKATFSKSVTGVGASDFVLSPGSTGGGNNGISPIDGISGSGDTYYVIVFPAVDGTYNLDLVSSGHNIADAASNPLTNTAPTGADQTYTVS